MSAGIRDLERLNSRQLENVKRRQDREIKTLENSHQNYKAELKKTHESEIVDIQDQNHRHIANENQKKEKVLEEMKAHLENSQKLTDKQLKSLKNMTVEERDKLQIKLTEDRQKINEDHELYLNELNHRFQTKSKQVNQVGKAQIEDMSQNMRTTYSDQEAFYNDKINQQTNQFNEKFRKETTKQKTIKDQTERQFKAERMATNQRQQIEIAKLTTTHTDAVKTRDTEFRKGLKEQDAFFEKKFEHNLGNHNEHLKNLDEVHDKVLVKMKTDLSKELTASQNRADDPFYQFTELKPQLNEYPDRVEIHVAVPEHAKQDLQITFNGKEAILNFNRRYNDSKKSEDGTVNKVNKIETFNTRITTSSYLDPKSVKGTYNDGIMSYVVKTA